MNNDNKRKLFPPLICNCNKCQITHNLKSDKKKIIINPSVSSSKKIIIDPSPSSFK